MNYIVTKLEKTGNEITVTSTSGNGSPGDGSRRVSSEAASNTTGVFVQTPPRHAVCWRRAGQRRVQGGKLQSAGLQGHSVIDFLLVFWDVRVFFFSFL